MLEKISEWDEALFLWLNQYHVDFLDPIMYFFTQTYPWIPLYIFLIFLVWKAHGKQGWWVILGVLLSVLLADQITSALMKPFFERLRPCHEVILNGMIHNYGKCGGMYGFASSHAANSFAVATAMYLGLSVRFPTVKWLFLWAVLFSYTRIYLGVHYPGDVLVGGLVGILCGLASYHLFQAVYNRVRLARNLGKIKTD
ncbi:phosphatase PAP2 family protein [Aquiflexum sp. TKW24L]|uniref:phosphatase PAP2 family protein n=1 Tax=Aquiflexum sp. TKW24L TaxID=2942212 RepID=UPI0020C14C82|nr:phosphatase PAP2 family protein [Aquiflexum sp. TKW24L]MCL6260275.1 phosphatase PAP2 family protein [Aquiflexum sp. TKW24L]